MGRRIVKSMLYHSGLLALARLARQRVRAVILRYHAITDDHREVPYAAPEICMPVAAFRLQMAFVRRAYRVVPLDVLVEAVRRGGPLPPRALVITFDDGYADNHRLAFPVLSALGMPATVYVATGSIGGATPFWVSAVRAIVLASPADGLELPGRGRVPLGGPRERAALARALARELVPLDAQARTAVLERTAAQAGVDLHALLAGTMLTRSQIRELHAAGWTIGAHTVTHSNLALVPPSVAEAEIRQSRGTLEAVVSASVEHFCYPNTGGAHPYFAPAVGEVLRHAGFASAVTSQPGAIVPGADRFLLPRLGVGPRLAAVPALAAAVERQRLAA